MNQKTKHDMVVSLMTTESRQGGRYDFRLF
jgi:hypothetical protein